MITPLANTLFLDTTNRRLVASPTSSSAAPPLFMPWSDQAARLEIHLLQFNGLKLEYVGGDAMSSFGAAFVDISNDDGTDIFATASGLNYFPTQVTSIDHHQDGGSGVNAIHEVFIAPQEGYFALRVSPDFDGDLALKRTPAFDNLSWQAQDIEEALNAIFGEVGTIYVSKVSDFHFHVEYSGALSDTAMPDLLQISQECLSANGLAFNLSFDTAKRSIVDAAGAEGYDAILTFRGALSMALEEHVLLSAPIKLYPTPDLP